MSQVLPNTRISTVADEVAKVFATIAHADDLRSGARDMLTDASQSATNAREDALLALAAAATAGQWSKYEIDEGCAKAIERRNSKDNTIATFASEIKLACHPSVRAKLPTLRQCVTDAWDAEAAAYKADKKLPRPIAKAFSRKYHALRACMKEVSEGREFAGTSAIVQFAVARDPDLDHVRVAKRLQAIRKALQEFYADFPVEGLRDCDEFLAEIGKTELEAARKAKLEGVNAPAPEASEPETVEPAQGVSDLLDEALQDMGA